MSKELELLKLELEVKILQNAALQDQLDKIHSQQNDIYTQINKLLLWKGSLKVKINESCPFPSVIGKECFLVDMFPDGCTVYHQGETEKDSDYYRINADCLDIVKWDEEHFQQVLKKFLYSYCTWSR